MAGRFHFSDLNPQQREAVLHQKGPLLILAGAGTGKTRVITARIACMIADGIPPDQLLAVTFTNKAANEMRERVTGMIEKDQAKKVTISTFHSLCVRVLRSGIDKLGYKKNFTIYDQSDQIGLLRKIIHRLAAKDEKLEPNLAKNLISKAKNQSWGEPPDPQSLVGAVYLRYQEELKLLNAVDFDDLLLLGVRLLADHEDVRQQWQGRFRYLMVDEFQDTNRLQLEMVTLLAGNDHNVCVVGDDDQSIYGWRGAEVSNILEFESHFANPTVVKLEQNYRSTNRILNAANAVIRHNPRRRPKQLWSSSGDGDPIRVIPLKSDRDESEYVCDELAQRRREGGRPWEDFAILFRMNAQSRVFEEQLRKRKIPYRLIGGQSFYDRREVKDFIAYLNVILNGDDDISLLRIINMPARGIGDTTVARAVEMSSVQQSSVLNTLRSEEFLGMLSARARGAIENFTGLIDRYETRILEVMSDYPQVAKDLLAEIDYFEALKKDCKTGEEALAREQNVKELINAMAEQKEKSSDGIRGFLDSLTLDQDREEKDKEKQENRGVTLITLHAAKGLEFPEVYLVGVEEGILPHDRSKVEGNLDEERRLFYVGITRAMRRLTLSHCNSRMRYGSAMPCQRSSFLKDLPEECVEQVDYETWKSTPVDPEDAKQGLRDLMAKLSGMKKPV